MATYRNDYQNPHAAPRQSDTPTEKIYDKKQGVHDTWDAMKYPPEIAKTKQFLNKHLGQLRDVPHSDYNNLALSIKRHLPAERCEIYQAADTWKTVVNILYEGKKYKLEFDSY